MSRIVKIGFLFFVTLVLSNCKPEDIDPSLFINIEDDFYIDMSQDLSTGENIFQLTVQSISVQNCVNAVIDYDLNIDNTRNSIVLSINDILEPETCILGSSHAHISIPFEEIDTRDYTIEINLKEAIINTGEFSVQDDRFYLEMDTDDGFEIINKELYKIPQKAIWGFVGYDEETDKVNAENFVQELNNKSLRIDQAAGYDMGYYGLFNILEDQTIELNSEIEERYHEAFIFHYNANNQDIIDLVDAYCSQYDGLNIYLFNGEGDKLDCD